MKTLAGREQHALQRRSLAEREDAAQKIATIFKLPVHIYASGMYTREDPAHGEKLATVYPAPGEPVRPDPRIHGLGDSLRTPPA